MKRIILFVLLLMAVGCGPSKPLDSAGMAGVRRVFVGGRYYFDAYVIDVDGSEYIVVRDIHAIAICPKTKKEPQ